MDFDELLNEYAERFNKAFPMYSFSGTEEDMIKTIKKCLEENKPYHIKYEKSVYDGETMY